MIIPMKARPIESRSGWLLSEHGVNDDGRVRLARRPRLLLLRRIGKLKNPAEGLGSYSIHDELLNVFTMLGLDLAECPQQPLRIRHLHIPFLH